MYAACGWAHVFLGVVGGIQEYLDILYIFFCCDVIGSFCTCKLEAIVQRSIGPLLWELLLLLLYCCMCSAQIKINNLRVGGVRTNNER